MQLEVGMILEGKVIGITKFGAFVELPGGKTGMVHISEIAPTFVKEISEFVSEGDKVKVKIISISDESKISLSMKKALDEPKMAKKSYKSVGPEWRPSNYNNDSQSFEDMMSKFKKTSDEKMSDLKKVTENKRGGFSRRGQSR